MFGAELESDLRSLGAGLHPLLLGLCGRPHRSRSAAADGAAASVRAPQADAGRQDLGAEQGEEASEGRHAAVLRLFEAFWEDIELGRVAPYLAKCPGLDSSSQLAMRLEESQALEAAASEL